MVSPGGAADRLERMKRDLQLLEGQFNSRYPDVVKLKTKFAILEREQAVTGTAANFGTDAPLRNRLIRRRRRLRTAAP